METIKVLQTGQMIEAYSVKVLESPDRQPTINLVLSGVFSVALTRDQVRELITRLNIALGASWMRHGDPDAEGKYSGGWVTDGGKT